MYYNTIIGDNENAGYLVSRARSGFRQLSPDQAALSRDTTWRYQEAREAREARRNKTTRKGRDDGRIIKLSDVPTDEEDDTLRGENHIESSLS